MHNSTALRPPRLRRPHLAVALVLLGLLATTSEASSPTQFVDEASCAGCHSAEASAWAGSHHDLAMQDANERTVLGSFAATEITHGGTTSRFFRRDGGFFVATDGADGKVADFAIEHTFGVDPLQQYLIDLGRGRKQALSIAWDTVAKRWFHLYPNETINFRDELHWTKPAQNWNHMCGECHATGYRKNYDAASATFKTTAARFDVGCQACHGPAARHLEWAQHVTPDTPKRPRDVARRDFDIDLAGMDTRVQLDTCGRCHARRSNLLPDGRPGASLMDTHLPALLSEQLYFADGQILDEVFEYGSFLQSRMHAKGVRCSDCHEPHSTKLRAPGNALCVTCHNPTAPAAGPHIDTTGLARKLYDSPAHHFHKPGTPGAQCIDCHAPARTYMVVDPRHDHSFRIPRPDLSLTLGTPNACNTCHTQQLPQWAAEQVAKWYGPSRRQEAHFGQALDAGRRGKPGAVPTLMALVDDATQPAIARATALELLARYPGQGSSAALTQSLRDADPLVRRAAVAGHERLAETQRLLGLAPLLDDAVRLVRIEAARLLLPMASSLPLSSATSLARVLPELEAVQTQNADRADALTNLGNLQLGRGEAQLAEVSYRQATSLDPHFVPAYVNLADLLRAVGREAEAEGVLRDGLRVSPSAAELHAALGLTLVRQNKKAEALMAFAAASKAAPDDPRHAYVYAVALDDAGRRAEAVQLLEATTVQRGDRDVLLALAAYAQQAGDLAGAARHLQSLAAINPYDPAIAPAPARQ